MTDEIPTVQILDKKDYFQQTLVALPNALPYPPLGPSSIRIRTTVLSLSVNNFTYAALGSLLGWWDVHPLPASAPAPYNDGTRYGRISAWGYADVVDSTTPSVPRGARVYGYVPLGTLAEDLEVQPHPSPALADRQVFVTSAHRKNVMPIYNRYFVYAPGSSTGRDVGVDAHDAVLRVMHPTAFLMADFVFSSDPSRVVAPGPGPDDDDGRVWNPRDADLHDATVLIFAPGAKVAASFAAMIGARTEAEGRPRRIVGASSEASRTFVEGTGVYDAVVSTGAADPVAAVREAAAAGVGEKDDGRLVVIDFGGRAGVAARWAAQLAPHYGDRLLFVAVGSAVIDPAAAPSILAAAAQQKPAYRAARVNADDMRRRAMRRVGEENYWAEEERSWDRFRRRGIKGLGVTWGSGMQDVIKGWDRLARGDVLPSEGLVYKL